MASLVTEALSSAGHLDKESIVQEIRKMLNKTIVIKSEVQEVLNNEFVSLNPIWLEATEVWEKLNTASEEMETIMGKIENELKPSLQNAVFQSDNVTQEIEKTALLASVILSLINIYTCLENSQKARIEKKYVSAANYLVEVVEKQRAFEFKDDNELLIVMELQTEQQIRRESLIYDLGELWKQKVVFKINAAEGITELSIQLKTIQNERLQNEDLLTALHIMNQLERKVQLFGQSLMSLFIVPIINSTVQLDIHPTITPSGAGSSEHTFKIKISSSETKPDAKSVCLILHDLFRGLSEALDFQVSSSFQNLNLTDPKSISAEKPKMLRILGKFFRESFCDLLTKQCLEPAVPSHSRELEDYSTVVAAVEQLDAVLQQLQFLDDNNESSIIRYAKNHDSLFANKICQDILSKSRLTMKKDLFLTTNVETSPSKSGNEIKKEDLDESDSLPGFIEPGFLFPLCKISKFVDELLDILHQTLSEACASSSVSATRLYFTARHIIEMFCDVVPVYHGNSITMFPQQTAIHHNNCMYLGHQLSMIGVCYKSKLTLTSDTLGQFPTITFIDLTQKLQNIGTAAFLDQMRRQRQQLYDFLQGSGVFQDMANDVDFLSKGDKAVRQCLLHLNSLRNVWMSVLPSEVYLRAIGTLCNSCLEEIILRVVTQEDITEKATEALDTIFAHILKEMPLLFILENNKPESVSELIVCQKRVRKWQKFQELKKILVSNLKEIVDRWASGMGPLAEDFTANEVKQLIRALFQNTERRSKALASIK